jgi:hypothetical protein
MGQHPKVILFGGEQLEYASALSSDLDHVYRTSEVRFRDGLFFCFRRSNFHAWTVDFLPSFFLTSAHDCNW